VGVLQLNNEKQLLKIDTSGEGDVNIRFAFCWILYFHPKQLLCETLGMNFTIACYQISFSMCILQW